MGARGATTTVLTIHGPLSPADLAGLCVRVGAQLEQSGATVAICDVGEHVRPDVVAVDALARLQLGARRSGCSVRLGRAPDGLEELLAFVGLDGVVPRAGSGLEARRQPEEREEPLGVEEEREPADPAR